MSKEDRQISKTVSAFNIIQPSAMRMILLLLSLFPYIYRYIYICYQANTKFTQSIYIKYITLYSVHYVNSIWFHYIWFHYIPTINTADLTPILYYQIRPTPILHPSVCKSVCNHMRNMVTLIYYEQMGLITDCFQYNMF